jgi:hypothetical protein
VFAPRRLFLGTNRSLPQSGEPERDFTQIGSGLTCKHWNRLEKFATNKHSSLFYICKLLRKSKILNTTHGAVPIKHFCSTFTHIFVSLLVSLLETFLAVAQKWSSLELKN